MERREFIKNTITAAGGTLLIPSIFLTGSEAFASAPNLSVDIDAGKKGEKLIHFWSNCVGAGRANEGLRASWLEQLKTVKKDCGFNYCRFHGLFHDDMFVYKELNGKAVYNWQYIDDLFDRMLAIGVRPFVELSFMPKDMASTENTTFWWKAHSCPPKDFQKWADLVKAFTRHCVDRYGLDEIKKWYFEVWNEPDLHGFWDGTKSQYFELYKVSALAVKDVHTDLKVGGPATSNFVPDERFDGETEDKSKDKTLIVPDVNALEWRGVWIKDFLNYCKNENLPLDFVSTHPYPTDYAIDPETKKGGGRVREVNATLHDLKWLNKVISESAYPHVQIHLTEWSSSPSSRDAMHDGLPVAAYIIKVNLDCVGLADSLSYWTFTDVFEEGGAGSSIFHGGFGLINYQGIVKPAFHGYRMLNALGDEILYRNEGIAVTRHSSTGKIVTLLYHYAQEMKDAVAGDVNKVINTGLSRLFNLGIKKLKPGAEFSVEILDKENGNILPKWEAIGKPEPPTRVQTEDLKVLAMNTLKTKVKANASGVLDWKLELQPWTCVFIKGSLTVKINRTGICYLKQICR